MTTKNLLRATSLVLLVLATVALYTSTFPTGSSAQVQNIQTSSVQVQASPAAAQALARLQSSSGTQIVSNVSRATGVYDFVRAGGTGTLPAADNLLGTPEMRARAFLSQNGDLVGMNAVERGLVASSSAPAGTVAASALKVAKVSTDAIGSTHVKFDQMYKGLKVFGAQLVVHMKSSGVTGVNGHFVPGIKSSTTPKISAAQAAAKALQQQVGNTPLTVAKSELSIYRKGLLEGYRGESALAYSVEVTNGKAIREQIWIDAMKGGLLNRISLNIHAGLNRIIYTPEYGEPFDVRHEGDPFTPGPTPGTSGADPINNLYLFAGHTYNLYSSGFGRDSYDGVGGTMHSVYLINDICPNAYWNGISTNYCPDFDADDVVSHEWSHGYTQYTHNLIYSYQPGALNEAYSDIFGESVDLLNGVDAEGGANNAQPMPNGQRWQMGEDVNALNQPALGILRDMWDPTRYQDPDKVSSPNYACGSGDSGGLHTNSGVPNHAFAMLVDGKTFNGQTVGAIGFTRALAIYYRAMTFYQTSTTDFTGHANALEASCADLIGDSINGLSTSSSTGAASSDVITLTTCQQVTKAIQAVEMRLPTPCPVSLILDPDEPPACNGSTDILVEDWETGTDGWTKASTGVTADWNTDDGVAPGGDLARLRNFNVTSSIPGGGGSGSAIHGANPALGADGGGTCAPGGDYSGQYTIESTNAITIPAGASDLEMRFDHYIASESGFDGAQVEISVNGAAFALVPEANYLFNGPNANLTSIIDANTNPNQGEPAWTGTNVGTPSGSPPGSWGTTIIDLRSLTNPGDTIKVRFTFSQDGCNGVDGWYVDNIRVYYCAALQAPTLSLGADYQNPDPNGSYTLNWAPRPAGASGPDVLQESSVCGPLLTDDAESGTGQWAIASDNVFAATWQTSNAKPQHAPNTAFWAAPQEQGFDSATLTFNSPIQIPSSGITTMEFSQWYFNEDDDKGFVEVSTNGGTSWTAIYTNARPMGDLPDIGVDAFANEGLTPQQLDLTPYSGQTIRLRFRYFQGESDFVFFVQYGWYIDDISITNNSWVNLTNADVTSFLVSGRSNGTRCYRARTTYPGGIPSPYSNQVSATSSLVAACDINVAHDSQGSVATASSTQSSRNYSPAGAINGDVIGAGWEQGGGWNDDTRGVWPDQLDVDFNTTRTINTINVYTLQNNYKNPVQPTVDTPADVYGILDFDVQYWNGTAWVTVPGGAIRGNTKALITISFADIATSKIRINVLNGRVYYSRIVEVEAIGCP